MLWIFKTLRHTHLLTPHYIPANLNLHVLTTLS